MKTLLPYTMHSLLLLSALMWILVGRVAAQGGKPKTIVTYEPLTDVRDQVRLQRASSAFVRPLSSAIHSKVTFLSPTSSL
jgi:hypothetical protein